MARIHIAARIVAPWKFSAGRDRADPEDVDPDQNADRHQQLRNKCQRAVRVGRMAGTRQAAPDTVRRQRPDADEREQQHHHLEQRVDRAVRHQHGGDGIAEAGRRMFAAAGAANVGAGSGNSSTIAASPADTRAQSRRPQAARRRPASRRIAGRPVRRKRALAPSSSPPDQSAADRGFGQRNIRRREPAPRPSASSRP